MSRTASPLPTTPTPQLESTLTLTPEPTERRAVIGGVFRDGTITHLCDSHYLDEIAVLFVHHLAELDRCIPTHPLKQLAGYVVAVDTIAERHDHEPGGIRRQPARLICVGGPDYALTGWTRFTGKNAQWQPLEHLGELGDCVGEMNSKLASYQSRVVSQS